MDTTYHAHYKLHYSDIHAFVSQFHSSVCMLKLQTSSSIHMPRTCRIPQSTANYMFYITPHTHYDLNSSILAYSINFCMKEFKPIFICVHFNKNHTKHNHFCPNPLHLIGTSAPESALTQNLFFAFFSPNTRLQDPRMQKSDSHRNAKTPENAFHSETRLGN